MNHIEKTTGKSYPIVQMTDEHLIKVIEYYLDYLEKIGIVNNIRYIIEFESVIKRLMLYVFVAIGRGIFNEKYVKQIKKLYQEYVEHKSKESRELLPTLWDSNLIS